VKNWLRKISDWFEGKETSSFPIPIAPDLSWDPAPLSDLISRLHQEPLLRPYLGLRECKVLLQSLQNGHGAENSSELKVLLAKLLVKNQHDHSAVAQSLESFIENRSKTLHVQLEALIRQLEAQNEPTEGTQNNPNAPRTPKQEPPAPPKSPSGDTQAGIAESKGYETSVQVELTLSPNTVSLPEIKDATDTAPTPLPQGHRFILTNDYHPLSRRQMDQIWRFLRKPSRTGQQAENIDLPRTVELFAKQGWLAEPAWQRDKINKVHLVLLIDQSSSMVAWNTFGKQLVVSAIQGGGHRDAEVLWFSNFPQQFESAERPGLLYKDPTRFKSEKMERLLRRCSKQNTEVLIFSDCGAARGGMNEERAKATTAWLQLLKKNVSSVAWLNPMPRRRWGASTADIIQHKVAMFETDQHGLMAAINHLRGR